MFLGLVSVFSGFFFSDLIIGNGTDFFIFNYNSVAQSITDFHLGSLHINLLGLYYSLFGICFITMILNKTNHYFVIKMLQPSKYLKNQFVIFNINLKMLFNFLSYRWYINFFYNETISLPTLKLGYIYVFLILDQGYITYMLGQMYVSILSLKYASYVFLCRK